MTSTEARNGLFALYAILSCLLLVVPAVTATADTAEAAGRVVIWDTQARVGETVDSADRNAWKAVPADLLTLETDPVKAFSDPGYYGREYTFAGDPVLENDRLLVVFRSDRGAVTVYSKTDAGTHVVEVVPLRMEDGPARITRCSVLQNAGDEAAIEAFFSTGDSAVLSLNRTGIMEIRPAGNMKGISLRSAIDYGVAPDFIGDDLVLSPAQYPSTNTLCVPAENLFLGLLTGESRMLSSPDPGPPAGCASR